MTSGWQTKLARLTQMDWDEIRTRTVQELHKRGDLLQRQVGLPPGSVRLSHAGAPGNFFFPATGAAARAGLLRLHLPDDAAEIVRDANEVCAHRFRLLGYENLDYGPGEIDWHLDRVHNKRAPLDPWFKIRFLDFAAVGDHKVTWELNRHQHFVTLAKAFLLTRDEGYLRELKTQWASWMNANPYPLGINWGSSLEVAFRSLSWIWVERLLGGLPAWSEFRAELLPALAFHGRYIERYLSTYFSPNTHLLGEAVALFFLGTLYPQMARARRWQEQGWKIVLREAGRQVRPDGVYFEQSLYYHVYALDFFLYARILGAANDMQIPASYDAVLQKMLNVVDALAQAGPAETFGDDDGGRLFNPRRNQTENMTDPLALGALAYRANDLAAARLTEESIWLYGERAITELAPATNERLARSVAFADGGLYVLADSQPCVQTMMIDAGPQGTGRCGHGHADALSLRLTMNGSRWLVDSGSGVYISPDPADRNRFRGTSAHNTICVDGADQAVAADPFSWTGIPAPKAESWLVGRTFSYFAGSHNGYERLADKVTHRRSLLRVNGSGCNGVWLVRDLILGAAEHDLSLNWHFASDVMLREASPGELIATKSGPQRPSLRLIWAEGTAWKSHLSKAQLSLAYGRYQSTTVLRSAARVKLPTEIATALLVEAHSLRPRDHAFLISKSESGVQAHELRLREDSHEFFFARTMGLWNSGPWSSDAELLYCRMGCEGLMQLIVIGGTSVEWKGRSLIKAPEPSKYFEWRKRDGTLNTEGEAFVTTPLFDELAGCTISSKPSAAPSFVEKD